MAKTIRINTTRLRTDAEHVDKDIKRMSSLLKSMRAHATELDRMWDGPGSVAFKKSFHDDINKVEVTLMNLRGLYQYEVTAKKTYEKCGQQVDQIISSIRV